MTSSPRHCLLAKGARQRLARSVKALTVAYALSGATDKALALREEVAFFQAVHVSLSKTLGTGGGSYAARELAIQQLIDQAMLPSEVMDLLASSALCPWREERLFEGARYALDSLVELWAVEEQEGRGGR